jgi:hypothetical protein
MKNKLLIVLLILTPLIVSAGSGGGGKRSKKPVKEVAKLDDVVKSLKTSYVKAATILQENNFKFKITEATVNLKVTKERSVEGEVGLFVKVKGGRTSGKQSSVTFKFTEPPAVRVDRDLKFVDARISEDELTNFIVASVQEFASLPQSNVIDGLAKGDIEIEVAFSLQKTGGGGVSFNIFSAEAEIGGELSSTVEHTITLTLSEVGVGDILVRGW